MEGRKQYDTGIVNHLFALLSSRLFLDTCMQSHTAISFDQQGVAYYLRWITGWSFKDSYFKTSSPAEPVIAECTAHMIMRRVSCWSHLIDLMFHSLFSPGFIDREICFPIIVYFFPGQGIAGCKGTRSL